MSLYGDQVIGKLNEWAEEATGKNYLAPEELVKTSPQYTLHPELSISLFSQFPLQNFSYSIRVASSLGFSHDLAY